MKRRIVRHQVKFSKVSGNKAKLGVFGATPKCWLVPRR